MKLILFMIALLLSGMVSSNSETNDIINNFDDKKNIFKCIKQKGNKTTKKMLKTELKLVQKDITKQCKKDQYEYIESLLNSQKNISDFNSTLAVFDQCGNLSKLLGFDSSGVEPDNISIICDTVKSKNK